LQHRLGCVNSPKPEPGEGECGDVAGVDAASTKLNHFATAASGAAMRTTFTLDDDAAAIA
jgi:hypothetical protein